MSMPLGDRILIGVDGKAGQPGTQFYDARDTVGLYDIRFSKISY